MLLLLQHIHTTYEYTVETCFWALITCKERVLLCSEKNK